MIDKKSAIPVGTQFSPNLINLGEFILALISHSGNKEEMQNAIWDSPVNIRSKIDKNKSKRTKNLPLEAAIQYGLLDKKYEATDFCRRLSAFKGDELYQEFAQHILLNLEGLRVVEAVQKMKIDNIKITSDELAKFLSEQGFNVGIHNTAINSMRMWLAEAKLFPKTGGNRWEVDANVKEKLVGYSDSTISSLAGLDADQRAFVLAICRVYDPNRKKYKASEIRDLAEMNEGRKFDRGNSATLLAPLKEAGLIEYWSRGTKGGKSAEFKVTDDFKPRLLGPFMEMTLESYDTALIEYYRKPIDEIYEELKSKNIAIKGKALEAFAIYIMKILGLRFVEWRKRARDETGQAEIDVLMKGLLGGVATRWQIQCKNKPSGKVTIDDVSKEVGLTPLTKATHIMIIANCSATKYAKTYAEEIMKNSALAIIIFEKAEFDQIVDNPASIAKIIREQSEKIEKIARYGLGWGK